MCCWTALLIPKYGANGAAIASVAAELVVNGILLWRTLSIIDVHIPMAYIISLCLSGVGMGAIVLDGAVVGENCIIGAGALVTGGTVVPDGSMVLGAPAKVKRELRSEEICANTENAKEYIRLAKIYNRGL